MARARWPDGLDYKLRKWLTRVQRVQAHLRSTLLIYTSYREDDDGKLVRNKAYGEQATRADRTVLYDALTFALDEFADVREQVQAVMDSVPTTSSTPGTPAKVAVMERRASTGHSIFIDGDAR